ncbi:MAG: CAP domain-containing protein [Patescibacteria group bacterium]|jgi:uncharacterized protein YkwD
MTKTNTLLGFLVFFSFLLIGYLSFYLIIKQHFSQEEEITPKPLNGEVLEILVNEYRRKNNYQPLVHDERLCLLAKVRAVEANTEWSHDNFFVWSEVWMEKYPYTLMGENLARQFATEVDTLRGWLKSEKHKLNIDYPYTTSCIACFNKVCAQIFGK